MKRPRRRTRTTASSSVSAPAATRAAYSPSEWPAATDGDDALRLQDLEDGDGVRDDRGLRDGRLLEVLVGALEGDLRDDEAERGERRVRAGVDVARLRETLGEVLPHAGELRALPGEQERDAAHAVTSGRAPLPTSGLRRTP